MIAATEKAENGIKWMPKVPDHWQKIRVKNLFHEIEKRSASGKEDLLSVSQYTGVTLRKDSFEEGKEITNAKTLKGYKIVEKGDLVVNIMLAWNGCLGISKYNGITSPAYCVYRVNENYNPDYFGFLFSTSFYKGEFRKRSTGIIDSRLRLYSDAFFRIFCFVPPKDEQDGIVNLIMSEFNQINHFIQTKQRFIELLKEQRQSIITHAVTKGIDEKAKMKETVLGEIPEHWELRRLKFCLNEKLKYGANASGDYYNPSWYRYIRITDFTSAGTLDENNKLSLSPENGKDYELKDGDILLARSGATVGKSFQFRLVDRDERCCYAGYLIKASPNDEIILSDFLYYFTLSSNYENWKNSIFIKATIENISADKYANLLVTLPPIEEQKRILEHIKTETKNLDIAISKAEREIELMKEYSESMIAEAVMGKML
ncbi:MAG: restriction endonuclease subunit S [Bacteroidota bacterium]